MKPTKEQIEALKAKGWVYVGASLFRKSTERGFHYETMEKIK